jgi:hypothetical protein
MCAISSYREQIGKKKDSYPSSRSDAIEVFCVESQLR